MKYQTLKQILLVLFFFLSISFAGASLSGCGGSGSSSDGTVTPPPPPPPPPPTTPSVTIAWDAPTTNEDGTPLTDLAGIRVYYGTSSGQYDESLDVIGSDIVTIGDLIQGATYYIAISAFDTSGYESDLTNEISVEAD